MALCMAASQPPLVKSMKYAKLLLTIIAAYPAVCRQQHDQVAKAAAVGKSMLARTCIQRAHALLR